MTLYCMANKLRMATVLYWGYHWGHLEETGRLPTGTSPTIPEGLAQFQITRNQNPTLHKGGVNWIVPQFWASKAGLGHVLSVWPGQRDDR